MLDDVKISMQKFGMPDYLVFIMMLGVCALIGIYFGFFEKKPVKKCDEESDYLVGGRQMKGETYFRSHVCALFIVFYFLFLSLFVKWQ